MSTTTLTQHLLTLNPEGFKKATQTKFLEKAGKGTLNKDVLEQWLAQDRLYAQAYVRFAGGVISGLQLPSHVEPTHLNERLLDLYLEALNNVRRELKFFEDVGGRYGLDINATSESEGVKGYQNLFSDTASKNNILESLILLWGTEKCYLEAWRHAASFLSENEGKGDGDADGGALRKEFIPNWTSPEFVQFVDRIEGLLQEVWEREGREGMGKAEELWERILEVEEGFWPRV